MTDNGTKYSVMEHGRRSDDIFRFRLQRNSKIIKRTRDIVPARALAPGVPRPAHVGSMDVDEVMACVVQAMLCVGRAISVGRLKSFLELPPSPFSLQSPNSFCFAARVSKLQAILLVFFNPVGSSCEGS